MRAERIWQISVDTGGTFTDCLAEDPDGNLHRVKVLSSSALRGTLVEVLDRRRLRVALKWKLPPDFLRGFGFRLLGEQDSTQIVAYDATSSVMELAGEVSTQLKPGTAFETTSPEEAPALAARLVTATPPDAPLPPVAMRLATTRGTNTLLERRGVPVAFFTTHGFGDLLRIRTQARPDIFALAVERPRPLYETAVEVEERVDSRGQILRPLDLQGLKTQVDELLARGIRVAAIALLNSFANPTHELELARFLEDAGFDHVSISSSLAPFIKLVPRAETAVTNAYLAPTIEAYLATVNQVVPDGAVSEGTRPTGLRVTGLRVMTSAGGLVPASGFEPKDSLLSGPAGGVAGAALAGRQSGFDHVIAFDMGGTSTDVARYGGDFEYVFEHTIADAHLVAPALAIESVAAGGGSICAFDGHSLRVGPESAGASPGPACYGAGGPLTVTDVNLLLGRLDANRFELPLSVADAEARFTELRAELEQVTGETTSPDSLLSGFLDIANQRMADTIRQVSLRRGYDPAEHALVSFGGAGGQHCCAIAALLGMNVIVVPQDAGILSALGLRHAVEERFAERQVLRPLDEVSDHVATWIYELEERALELIRSTVGASEAAAVRRRIAQLRFRGQDATLDIEYRHGEDLQALFLARYSALYGHPVENRAVEIVSLRVVASTPPTAASAPARPPPHAAPSRRVQPAFVGGVWRDVPTYEREHLQCGARLMGPALISEAHSATVLEEGWDMEVDGAENLVLRHESTSQKKAASTQSSAVKLELFTHRFGTVAREMGAILERTALSTNVKERLDFSCAVLDPAGELVVNAPHIPVHLGALGLCVRAVREALNLEEGDVAITNHPAFGGSHLPDVTLITPVYDGDAKLIGHVASRAHHAEIGGTRPGSMPPAARSLTEEGVVIAPTFVVRGGSARWDHVRRLFATAPYPSRAVEENIADLRAAVAANHRGAQALRLLVEEHGTETVLGYMAELKQSAERRLREALQCFPDGSYEATEELDDGSPLRVAIEIRGTSMALDFAGSAPVHIGNLNATPAIVRSVVIYVLRLLISEPLPLNEGLLRPVEIRLPEGLLNPPFPPNPAAAPAVVGGNVETSQRLVGLLLKALRVAASSQGTMNNVLFGTDRFGYYETVGGGCGATPSAHGESAVHSHMTNTRITDPEILEHRYPVRVLRFAVRVGSGGSGTFHGGDGIVRELEFLEPVSLSVLTQHRTVGPYGLAGGEPGQAGRQCVIRANGDVLPLDSLDECELEAGDRFLMETPGGGGWGEPMG